MSTHWNIMIKYQHLINVALSIFNDEYNTSLTRQDDNIYMYKRKYKKLHKTRTRVHSM